VAADDVDAVVVASPGFVHEEQVLACIEAGKPVLCEKPLTLDPESSLRIVNAERAAGRRLVTVGFMRRFDPEYAQLRALIDGGQLGRALMLHNTHRNRSVPDSFTTEMVVRDSLVHEVDAARFLLGEEIIAVGVRLPRSTTSGTPGLRDPQMAMFDMAGGALVDTEVFVNSTVGYEVRCEAVLERGNVTIGRDGGPYTRADGRAGVPLPLDYRTRFARAYDIEVQSWVDSVRSDPTATHTGTDTATGTGTGASAWDGYAAVAVCAAGVEALHTGRTVSVDMVPAGVGNDEMTAQRP
jgi:myo-inositol 2-dehydrogenase/D-chiro-inositol 1-dehydrogenase